MKPTRSYAQTITARLNKQQQERLLLVVATTKSDIARKGKPLLQGPTPRVVADKVTPKTVVLRVEAPTSDGLDEGIRYANGLVVAAREVYTPMVAHAFALRSAARLQKGIVARITGPAKAKLPRVAGIHISG